MPKSHAGTGGAAPPRSVSGVCRKEINICCPSIARSMQRCVWLPMPPPVLFVHTHHKCSVHVHASCPSVQSYPSQLVHCLTTAPNAHALYKYKAAKQPRAAPFGAAACGHKRPFGAAGCACPRAQQHSRGAVTLQCLTSAFMVLLQRGQAPPLAQRKCFRPSPRSFALLHALAEIWRGRQVPLAAAVPSHGRPDRN